MDKCKFNVMFVVYAFQVDKDAVASWVLSLQAHPTNKAELNDGTGLVAKKTDLT